MDFFVIVPFVVSSTSLLRICIAGSAITTIQPIIRPIGINQYLLYAAIWLPILKPIEMYTVLTVDKNNTSPAKVNNIPIPILLSFLLEIFKNVTWHTIKNSTIKPNDIPTSFILYQIPVNIAPKILSAIE